MTSRYYVTNKELLPEIIEFKKTGKMSGELGRMLLAIATNYSSKGSFAGYTWREDMVSDALLTCVKYLHNFDPDKQKYPNPFAYITMICHNAFVNYINKQKRHSKIKDICYKQSHLLEEENFYTVTAINYEKLVDGKKKKKRKK